MDTALFSVTVSFFIPVGVVGFPSVPHMMPLVFISWKMWSVGLLFYFFLPDMHPENNLQLHQLFNLLLMIPHWLPNKHYQLG